MRNSYKITEKEIQDVATTWLQFPCDTDKRVRLPKVMLDKIEEHTINSSDFIRKAIAEKVVRMGVHRPITEDERKQMEEEMRDFK